MKRSCDAYAEELHDACMNNGCNTKINKTYDEYMKKACNDHPLRGLLAVGLKLMELVGYRYSTAYDRRIGGLMAQIYGIEEADIQLRLFWASRVMYLLLTSLFTGFLALLAGLDAGLLIFWISVTCSVLYFTDRDVRQKLERRKTLIRLDFPDFVNKLALLINAGMTMESAWKKIVAESKKPDSPLYRELLFVMRDMEAGKPELAALENFAKRCAIPEITRFVSVLVQNLKKGGAQMVSVLRISASECWLMRKNAARKMGEEASTKMLLPIMLIFLAILLITATPAILAMRFI